MISFAMPGDLKLEITGDEEIRISVFFRAYPTAQRNRPMTKSEAKRGQNIIPLIARTGETTRVAVIETAAAGIYEFIAEPAGDKSTSAAFLLKLYEAGSKAKTKPCGRKTIAGKTVIVKILMPEGILWDDETAFTGSMEDSDSVTKFNSDTGLLWKEYRE